MPLSLIRKTPAQIFAENGNRINIYGSSSVAACVYNPNSTKFALNKDGFFTKAQLMNGGYFFVNNIYGFAGQNTEYVSTQMNASLATDTTFDVACLYYAANELPAAAPTEAIETTLWADVRTLLSKGKRVILVIPHKIISGNAANYNLYEEMCNKISVAFPNNVKIANHYRALINYDSQASLFLPDGVHLNQFGCYQVALNAWASIYSAYFGSVDLYPYLAGFGLPTPNNPKPTVGYSVSSGSSLGAYGKSENYRDYVDFIGNPVGGESYARFTHTLVSGVKYVGCALVEAITAMPTPQLRIHNVDASVEYSFNNQSYFGDTVQLMHNPGEKLRLITRPFTCDSTLASYARLQLAFEAHTGPFTARFWELSFIPISSL